MAPVEDPILQCLSLTSNVPNKRCLHAYNWKLGHARSPSVHVLRCSLLVITPSSKLQTPSSLLHCTFIFKKFLFSGIFATTPLNIIFLPKFPTVVKGWSFGSDSFLHSICIINGCSTGYKQMLLPRCGVDKSRKSNRQS